MALQARLGSAVFEDCVLAGRAMPIDTILMDARNQAERDTSPKLNRSEAVQATYAPLSAREWEIARHVARRNGIEPGAAVVVSLLADMIHLMPAAEASA